MSNQAPAGWYPAPHANNEQRYWDGSNWIEPPAVAAPVTTAESAPARRRGVRWWAWLLIGFGALILLIVIIGSLNRPAPPVSAPAPAATSSRSESPAEVSRPPEAQRISVPAVTGMTVAEARAALTAAGFAVTVPDGVADDWTVETTVPLSGTITDPGSAITLTGKAPEPVLTLGQKNAIAKGKSYLEFTSFSRTGLIDQLVFEGFSNEEATFAVDTIAPDWGAQAAKKAQNYLDLTAFSRDGLAEQLAFEGFTPDEVAAGLAAVGY